MVDLALSPESAKDDVSPTDVIAWLITQPNAKGTLYLESVAKTYMSALRNAPRKLALQVTQNRDVFGCHTVSEFIDLCTAFKDAPNYNEVNKVQWRGQLSAGLAVYQRYLEHLEKSRDTARKSKDDVLAPAAPMPTRPSLPISTMPPRTPTIHEQLIAVLLAHFTNGYRLDSPIEMVRFRSFATVDLEKELTLSDDELKIHIAACGIIFDGKIYIVSSEARKRIRGIVEGYFADGAQAIFYDEFYAKNESWLLRMNVMSAAMLTSILREMFPKLSFTRTYFGHASGSVFAVLETEILRVWGEDILLTYAQLAERLLFIPLDRIKSTLSQSGDFIWNSVGTFSHISRIGITDKEKKAIRSVAMRECNACGYVSITNLPFSEIEDRNYKLSLTAVHNAVYHICLSDKYDKKGKIITRKGDVFDALTIMKEHCQSVDKCSLDDLLSYEKELTGEIHRWVPMEAGNAVLIRTDKYTYMAERYIRFNTELIDEAIELVIGSDYLPLKSFITFGAFPDCGKTWNLFLLESYCRRFSHKFRFDTPSVNSKNIGVVIRKNCCMNYSEIMADAVVNADIPLNKNAVGGFLINSGYIGRTTYAKVTKIIDMAKTILERRD